MILWWNSGVCMYLGGHQMVSIYSWVLWGPCCVQAGHPFLHFEWVDIPGHVVTNETSSPPLCRSCGLIPDMYIPNYYKTEWINVLDVESLPSKYQPMMTSVLVSIIQSNLPSLIRSTSGLGYVTESNAFLPKCNR